MPSKIVHASVLVIAVVLVLGCTIWAQSSDADAAVVPTTQTITAKSKGTLGPILSGSDPLGLNGASVGLTVLVSESLSPKKHTSTSATYTLPAGAITVEEGNNKFSTTSPSNLIVKLTSTADILTLSFVVSAEGEQIAVTDTAYLKAKSWTTAVLKHPRVFKPSPQKLTSAKTAGGPGSQLKYTIEGSTTVLGFAGTDSNSAKADPVLPDEDQDSLDVDQ
ncbi:MAG TPA: hypothetical protein VN950_14730 [Terriglobales bacterium]|nr:hypothetical protein [Terriglobales bacterium]